MIKEPRHAKKSETLEFRLPYDEKVAFLEQVSKSGRSASDVLRRLVSDYPQVSGAAASQQGRNLQRKNHVFMGLAALAFGAIAVPVLADQTLFAAYDVDGNGRITAGEISSEGDADIIAALDSNKNGWVSFLELKPEGRGEIFSETINDYHDGTPKKRWLEFSFVTFSLKPDRNVVQDIKTGKTEIPLNATDAQVLRVQASIRVQMSKS